VEQSSGTARIAWKSVSLWGLLMSTLTYEYAVPLFLLNPVLTWYRARRVCGPAAGRRRVWRHWLILAFASLAMLVVVAVFKLLTTDRLAQHPFSTDQVVWFVETAKAGAYYQLATLGLYLPRTAWQLFNAHPGLGIATLAVATFCLSLVYVYHLARRSAGGGLPSRRCLGALVAAGAAVYVLSSAIFFMTHGDLQATPTGQGNRTAIATAGGVALFLVGASGLVSTLLPVGRLQASLFSTLIAIACTAGVVIINSLAVMWVAAAEEQYAVLNDIQGHFPSLAPGTVLILDGLCQYKGPAVVFEGGTWDLTGAIWMRYGDASIKADLVTPRLSVTKDSIVTQMYGYTLHYPLEAVLLYNLAQGKAYRFAHAEAAQQYFATFNPDLTSGCPEGVPGYGVPVV
jgi:hypothetical protein